MERKTILPSVEQQDQNHQEQDTETSESKRWHDKGQQECDTESTECFFEFQRVFS